MRPFRFGVLAARAGSRKEWISKARRAEASGFDTFLVSDHLWEQLGPVAAAMSVVEQTALRIGFLVLCNDFRNPVVLAKEAATIDMLSEGRLELGIGAGWLAADYDQAGLPMDSPGVRIDRLAEAITIMKGLFSGEDEFQFAGDHYRIGPIQGTPRPVQRPHPPFLIGGGGPRMLRLAAREAQIVGIAPNLRSGRADPAVLGSRRTAVAMAESVSYVRDAAGDRLDKLELNVAVIEAELTDDRRAVASRLAKQMALEIEEVLESPQILIGTVDQICEQLQEQRDTLGISYIGVIERGWDALEPVVERLAGT